MKGTKMINTQNAIYSEVAYEAGARARIIANAQKTFFKTYPRATEVANFLNRYDETSKESFMKTMAMSLQKYGKLTEKQYDAVCQSIDRFAELKVKRDAEIAEQKAKSQFLGVMSEKIQADVILEKSFVVDKPKFSYYDQDFAIVYLFRDADGNRLVWKTTAELGVEDGVKLTINAVIKAHSEYKGEKQTIIQRVKVLKTNV